MLNTLIIRQMELLSQHSTIWLNTGPDGRTLRQRWIKGIISDICHRGCVYTVLKTVQKDEVYSAVYGSVHY